MSQLQTQTKTIEVDSAQILAEAIAAHDARVKERTHIPVKNGEMAPADFDGIWRLANWMFDAGMLPSGVKTVSQVALVIAKGMAIGTDPTQALENIMVVNNRCTVWGDLALALVRSARDLHTRKKIAGPVKEWIDKDTKDPVAWCEVVRIHDDGTQETVKRGFSKSDAELAGLWGKAGPWKQYPSRMLQMRARAFALRDAFPDVLKGIGIREEVEDYDARPSKNSAPDSTDDVKALIASLPQRKMPESGGGSAVAPDAPAPAQADKPFDPADISEQMDAALAKKGVQQ